MRFLWDRLKSVDVLADNSVQSNRFFCCLLKSTFRAGFLCVRLGFSPRESAVTQRLERPKPGGPMLSLRQSLGARKSWKTLTKLERRSRLTNGFARAEQNSCFFLSLSLFPLNLCRMSSLRWNFTAMHYTATFPLCHWPTNRKNLTFSFLRVADVHKTIQLRKCLKQVNWRLVFSLIAVGVVRSSCIRLTLHIAPAKCRSLSPLVFKWNEGEQLYLAKCLWH